MYNQLQSLKLNEWYNYEKLFTEYNQNVGKFGDKKKTGYTQALNKYCAFHGITPDWSEPNGVKHVMLIKDSAVVEPSKLDEMEPQEIWDELNKKAKQ